MLFICRNGLQLDPNAVSEGTKQAVAEFLQSFNSLYSFSNEDWNKAIEERLKQSALNRLSEDLTKQISTLESSLQQQEEEVANLVSQRDSNMQQIEQLESEIKAIQVPSDSNEMEEIEQMMLELNSFSTRLQTQHKLQY